MNERFLLTLIASPDLEESLVDWLLKFEYGFSSFALHGHSSRHEGLTLAELVSGRKRQIRFEIHLPDAELTALIERLKKDFAGVGMYYWVSPVVDAGHI